MRSFIYKNSVWKSSWYQKQATPEPSSLRSAGIRPVATSMLTASAPEGNPAKFWAWLSKRKSIKTWGEK